MNESRFWRKITEFLGGGLTKGTETTPFEILGMLAILLIFILVYSWLDELQALLRQLFV